MWFYSKFMEDNQFSEDILKSINEQLAESSGTQQEAIDAGREIARNQGGELLIHGRNGQIRERDSSGGKDDFPPRG